MILSFEQIKGMIAQNEYKCAILFAGHINPNNLKGISKFESIVADSTDLIIGRLEDIKNTIGGNYTIAFGNGNTNQNIRSMAKVQASFTRELNGAPVQDQNPQKFSHIDKATIIAEAKAEFKKELQAIEDKKEIEEMKTELIYLRTWGGKASLMVDNLMKMYFDPNQLMNTVMQGTKPQQQQPDVDNMSKQDIEEIENACALLIKTLGADVVIKLAAKLQTPKGAGMIPMVKNFVNN